MGEDQVLGGISPRAVRLGSGKYVNGDYRQSEEEWLTGTGRRYAFTAGIASHSVVYLSDLCALAECQSEACPAVPPTGPGGRRADGPKTGHALTFIVDHSKGADQTLQTRVNDEGRNSPVSRFLIRYGRDYEKI